MTEHALSWNKRKIDDLPNSLPKRYAKVCLISGFTVVLYNYVLTTFSVIKPCFTLYIKGTFLSMSINKYKRISNYKICNLVYL